LGAGEAFRGSLAKFANAVWRLCDRLARAVKLPYVPKRTGTITWWTQDMRVVEKNGQHKNEGEWHDIDLHSEPWKAPILGNGCKSANTAPR